MTPSEQPSERPSVPPADDAATAVLSALRGHVLLVGGYGAGNLGDEAILSGMLAALPPAVTRLSVVSRDPAETRRVHAASAPAGVVDPIEPRPASLLRRLLAADAVVVGGGGIFSRYMGPNAARIPAFVLLARALGKPVHWVAVGVYPSTPPRTMRLLERALLRSTSVSVRDRISERTLRTLGVRDVRLVADPATRLVPDREVGRDRLRAAGYDLDRPILAVAARSVKGEDDARLRVAYRDATRTFLDRGWQVVYLPFCRHPDEPVEQDVAACEALAAEFGGSVIDAASPAELLGVVAAVDALVATRLHAMIFAVVADTPFVAVEYDDKVSSLLAEYGDADRGVALAAVDGASLVRVLDASLAAAAPADAARDVAATGDGARDANAVDRREANAP